MNEVWQALVTTGLLPTGRAAWSSAGPWNSNTNLLPLVLQAWHDAFPQAEQASESERIRATLGWLNQQAARGACLTVGIPDLPDGRRDRWLGRRLAWWPRGIPSGRRVGLVSSRLGRALDLRTDWFSALRTACLRIDPDRDILVTAPATTTARFVERCAVLFGLRVLRIVLPDETAAESDQRFTQWGRKVIEHELPTCSDVVEQFWLSPSLGESRPAAPLGDALADVPLADRAVVGICDALRVLHVRPDGQIHRLVRERLTDPEFPVASCYVTVGPTLVSTDIATDLQDRGAVRWVLLHSAADDPNARTTSSGQSCQDRPASDPSSAPRTAPHVSAVDFPVDVDWPFLTHCTRRRHGPWPEQGTDEYLDDLILDHAGADHSAFAALCRIVKSQRLTASSTTIRGGHRIVSFTAVPLRELQRLRVFRPHRTRWDFEPYGLCIRRDWLERLGTRPVRYGDAALWRALPPEDQPLFQFQVAEANRIDWTVEEEWRHMDDVDLSTLPDGAAIVFAPTDAECRQLAPISRWPVAVLEASSA